MAHSKMDGTQQNDTHHNDSQHNNTENNHTHHKLLQDLETLFDQSLNECFWQKINSILGSNVRYLVTIHIDLI